MTFSLFKTLWLSKSNKFLTSDSRMDWMLAEAVLRDAEDWDEVRNSIVEKLNYFRGLTTIEGLVVEKSGIQYFQSLEKLLKEIEKCK